MEGVLRPGTPLPQVQLAERLGISRTPLREAIRMLQEEGLVEAEPQKRARVTRFDPAHLEAVYTRRVMLESTALMLGVGLMQPDELAELDERLADMQEFSLAREPERWQDAHRRFHLLLVQHVSKPLLKSIVAIMELGEHYRLLYQSTGPRAWRPAFDEHARIVERVRAKDGPGAAADLASHLARTALVLIAEITPGYDPLAVRAALAVFHADVSVTPPKPVDAPKPVTNGRQPR
jgi:DNA-binding GntR family transcriptional regulator